MNENQYLTQMFGLENQIAVISGGAGVIGTEMAKALLQAGATVVVWSRSKESIDHALAQLKPYAESSNQIGGGQVDAGDEDGVKEALLNVEKSFGVPQILINAVGGNIGKSAFVESDIETFKKVLDMNLIAGLVVPTKVVANYWIERKVEGSIINLTSMASYNPLSGVWAYDAAKAGVLNLTQATANELADYKIRVNAIAPGFFLGKQNKAILVNQETGELTDRGKQVIERTPYSRFGEPEELAGATVFLASRKASGFVTGVSIPVDGGFLADNI